MKAYYEQDGITIYHGDCRDVLPMLPPACYAVVTDPPFGIGFAYGTYEDDATAYSALMRDWIAAANAVIHVGPFFVWQAMKTCERWHEWFPRGWRILAACKGFVQFRPTPIQYSWDPVIFWGNLTGEPSVYRKDYHLQSLAPFGANRPRIEHPCPRPLEQMRYVVEIGTSPTDVIIDPFLGSGTCLRAAKDLNRRAIGIEIEERYCEIAANRLAQTVMQLEVP